MRLNQPHQTRSANSSLLVVAVLLLLGACSHPIEIQGKGKVLSASGDRDCKAGQSPCTFVIVKDYVETYTAVPSPGHRFSHWVGCGKEQTNQCDFNVPAATVAKFWGQSAPPLVASFEPISDSSKVKISGAITYDRVPHKATGNGLDYSRTTREPARSVTVELLNANGKTLHTTTTDVFGSYSFEADSDTKVRVRAKAEMVSDSWDFKITDNTRGNALYVLQGSLASSGSEKSRRNLHAKSGWNNSSGAYSSTRAAAPFAILDVVYNALQLLLTADPSIFLDDLQIHWSERNSAVAGRNEIGDIGTSHYDIDEEELYILGKANNDTDEYDTHVIAHEFGHFLEFTLSRADSIGGQHMEGDRLDMRVALSEGWGNAFSGMVFNDPLYQDSMGHRQASGFSLNVENNNGLNPGWYSEASVQSVLYDLFDSKDDGADTVSDGFASLYTVLTSARYKRPGFFDDEAANPSLATIYLLFSELKHQFPALTGDLDALANKQKFVSKNPWGNGETNKAGVGSTLPVYHNGRLGKKLPFCTTNKFNGVSFPSPNKLGNSVFFKFLDLSGGNYTVTLNRTSGTANPLVDVELLVDAKFFRSFTLNNANNSWSSSMEEGDYVIVFTELNAKPACFNFTLTNN